MDRRRIRALVGRAALAVAALAAGSVWSQDADVAQIEVATHLAAQGRCEDARDLLESLVEQVEEPPASALYHLAVCQATLGHPEAADRRLGEALARDSEYLPAIHLKAYFQFAAGRYDEALRWSQRYLALRPDGGETRKISGLARFMLGDKTGAGEDLRQATRLLPQDFEAHYYLGRVLFEMSKLTPALEAFGRAIEIEPTSVKAHNHLGQTLEGLTRFEEAKDAYGTSIAIENRTAERSEWPYFNLGSLLLSEGEVPRAIEFLERALQRNPASAQTKTKLAVAYNAASRLEEATARLEEVVLAEPDHADAHFQLGRVLMKRGLEGEARKHLAEFERLRRR